LYRFIAFNNVYHKNFVSNFFETLKYKFHGIICWRKMDVKLIFELRAHALYGVALAGRKPAAMRAHGGDKILFPLLVQ
jgi:hypothetical protein